VAPTGSPVGTPSKVARFAACLALYPSTYAPNPIFDANLNTNPRFVWAPEYVFDSPPGSKFNPIRGFRPMYLGGVWLNCPSPSTGMPCGAVFYPDQHFFDPICDPAGPGCRQVTVDQISSWLFPAGSLPQSLYDDFDATFGNLEPELFQ
jgi:hypothetical protein